MTDSGLDAAITARMKERSDAIRAKDVDAMLAQLAPELVTFDIGGPLRQHGREAVRARLQEWFGGYDGPVGYNVRDLTVKGDGDCAFSYCLVHISGTLSSGGSVSMWVRVTVGWERHDGAWLAVHDHMSDPMDFETGKARTDLKP